MAETQAPEPFVVLPAEVSQILFRLIDGWSPRASFGRLASVTWAGRELGARVERIVPVDDGQALKLVCRCTAEDPRTLFSTRNQPIRGTFADGGHFDAQFASGVRIQGNLGGGRDEMPQVEIEAAVWRVLPPRELPRLWVADVRGTISRRLSGNIVTSRRMSREVQSVYQNESNHLRLGGRYTYYLVRGEDTQEHRLCIDLGTPGVPDREILDAELCLLGLVLGTSLRVDILHGIDECGAVTALMSGYGVRGDSSDGLPPVPFPLRETWVAPLFQALSRTQEARPDLRLQVPIFHYLQAIQPVVDTRYLHLQLALGALVHQSSPPEAASSIPAAFERVDLHLPEALHAEITSGREHVLRTGEMPGAADVDAAMLHIARVRTAFVALLSRLVGYGGPIVGFEEDDPYRIGPDSWWREHMHASAEKAAMRCYVTEVDQSLDPVGANQILVMVEDEAARKIVRSLMEAAGFPLSRVVFEIVYGLAGAQARLRALDRDAARHCIVLARSGERSVPDARKKAAQLLGSTEAQVYCAVPEVEAWLFADEQTALNHASPEAQALDVARRLPLPEEIPEPAQLARMLFGSPDAWTFVRDVDISRACARSPSLSAFLSGIASMLGVEGPAVTQAASRTISRDALANLIAELVPSDVVAWRTTDGATYTAEQIRRHIEEGTEIGRAYASDLLRISRDLLRRMAKQKTSA